MRCDWWNTFRNEMWLVKYNWEWDVIGEIHLGMRCDWWNTFRNEMRFVKYHLGMRCDWWNTFRNEKRVVKYHLGMRCERRNISKNEMRLVKYIYEWYAIGAIGEINLGRRSDWWKRFSNEIWFMKVEMVVYIFHTLNQYIFKKFNKK